MGVRQRDVMAAPERAVAGHLDRAYLWDTAKAANGPRAMSEIATSETTLPRFAIAAAVLFGGLIAVAGLLWAYYGTAVFMETVVAGLAGCF
jgi:hypothetical protein